MIVRRIAIATLTPLFLMPLPAAAQQAAPDGERLFRTRCASCHSTDPGQNRIGPHLAGVLGRDAGSIDGARYSQALKAADIVWDETTLDSYLADPRGRVPGTTMTVALRNDSERAAVIAYLRDLPAAK